LKLRTASTVAHACRDAGLRVAVRDHTCDLRKLRVCVAGCPTRVRL